MSVFKINLARSRVIPAGLRRNWYQGLILYLLLSGLILVLMAGAVTRSLIGAVERHRQLSHREQQNLLSYPTHRNIAGYAARTGTTMARYASKLEAVTGIMGDQARAAAILTGLVSPLTGDMSLTGMDMNAGKGEITFEVWTPEDAPVTNITPPGLVLEWNRLPTLTSEVSDLASTGKQNAQLNGRRFSVWRFAGRLRQNGA